MRIALFGGSFDPFHYGHIELIRGALDSGAVDTVIVIPAVNNSFKRGRALLPAPYRYYMTKNAVESEFPENVFISDIEFGFEGITYTVNTLREIVKDGYIIPFLMRNGVPGDLAAQRHQFFWLCGSDILPTFDKWYMPEKILSYAVLLVAQRKGDYTDVREQGARLKSLFGCDIAVFEMNGVDQSSSAVKSSGNYDSLPPSVREFIDTHDIYNAVKALDRCSDEACAKYYRFAGSLYYLLGGKRLLHTLNVGLLSAKLAFDHGADCDKALIAGELHDCAKEIDMDEQRRLAIAVAGDLFVDDKLLHSPAGAYMAREKFGIEDREILDAITYHTTGRGGMTVLDKIVYLADKIEPSRTYTDLSEMRRIAPSDLNGAVRLCLDSVNDKFKRKGRTIHPLTVEFGRQLQEEY